MNTKANGASNKYPKSNTNFSELKHKAKIIFIIDTDLSKKKRIWKPSSLKSGNFHYVTFVNIRKFDRNLITRVLEEFVYIVTCQYSPRFLCPVFHIPNA